MLHELTRVYFDRVMSEEAMEKTKTCLLKHFSDSFNRKYMGELESVIRKSQPLLFAKVVEGDYHQLSAELGAEQAKFEEFIKKNEMKYVLPKFITSHLCRMLRLEGIPFTNCIYIGNSGSGKKTIVEIAGKISGVPLVWPPNKKRTDTEMSRHLFNCVKTSVSTQKPVFLCLAYETCPQYFILLLENLLAGNIEKFEKEDTDYAYDHIHDAYGDSYNRRDKSVDDVVWDYITNGLKFLKVIVGIEQKNLQKLRAYPALYSSCYINSIGQWPESALE